MYFNAVTERAEFYKLLRDMTSKKGAETGDGSRPLKKCLFKNRD